MTVIVEFTKKHEKWERGVKAGFAPDEATKLIQSNVAKLVEPPKSNTLETRVKTKVVTK